MTERTLKALVGALAVAVAIWVVATLFAGGSGSIQASGAIADVFDGVTDESVESIRIERLGRTTTLERADGQWTANGFPADPDVVRRLLDELPEVRIGELTASNPANHDRMGVSADSAITVTLAADGRARSLLIGKAGRRFGTAYVRLPEADEVYLLEGDLRGQITRDLDGWRDRTMALVDSSAVTTIEVTRPGATYTLERADSSWTVRGGGPVAPHVVNGILSELSHLVATGFLDPDDSIATRALASTTRALNETGTVLAEITLGEGEADRWARNGTNDHVYRVTSFRAGRVAPRREDIAPGA